MYIHTIYIHCNELHCLFISENISDQDVASNILYWLLNVLDTIPEVFHHISHVLKKRRKMIPYNILSWFD